MNRRGAALAALMIVGLTTTAAGAETITVDGRGLREISGAVSATGHDGVWAVTDSGTRARLYAIDVNGQLRQTVRVRGVRNHDWEALAKWRRRDGNWLVIGDIGDNRARRKAITVHVAPEPTSGSESVAVAATLTLTYPDGARDAEAMAIDSAASRLYILSKRDQPPRLYSAPLQLTSSRIELKALGPVTTIPPPTAHDRRQDPKYGHLRSQPVGLDIDLAGTRLVIGTYKDAYIYERSNGERWAAALSRPPLAVDTPQLPETQAAAFHRGRLITISEGRPASLAITPLP